ncbi:RBL2A-like protein [Mya arenaria]|uniref:RBL2A-like protein n=1 Tax=Mya arenaria TaxID=6604 RepID=A0ABY7EGK7_MYAAR|nr:RBL2A-like protein [Mya arenaria]
MAKNGEPDYDQLGDKGECKVKIICLGDSAVGKSNKPQQLSTYALTLFNYKTKVNDTDVLTSGILPVFDSTRKVTYKNLPLWLKELREYPSDGTNVVKMFNDAIRAAVAYKNDSTDFMDEIMRELENFELEQADSGKSKEKEEVSDSGLDSPGNHDNKEHKDATNS